MATVLMDDDGVVGETVASGMGEDVLPYHLENAPCSINNHKVVLIKEQVRCHREILPNPCPVGAVALLAFDRLVYSFRKRPNTR